MKLLIVEDAPRLRTTVGTALNKIGHTVDLAPDGAEAAVLLIDHAYDAVVLDIMLPGIDGLELLRRMRGRGDTTPVLMLTARDSIEDRVGGLAAGADDYLVKPFSLAELAARLEALHRRRHGIAQPVVKVGPVEINTGARQVLVGGKEIQLTAREYALLEYFALRPRRILSREQIEAHLYPDGGSPASNAVDSAICQLRRKLSPDGSLSLIHTRRGLGYTLDPTA
ncbi:MAG: response regulator transcription factor [Verrucomicrobiaceae bacterium]|nr:MAG: response regulator transcription factor [Verrucomicrobiaceae bacterium]